MVSFLISNTLFNRRFNYLRFAATVPAYKVAARPPNIVPLQLCASPERATRIARENLNKISRTIRYPTEDVSLIATQFVLILPDIPIDDIARAPVPCSLTIADSPSHVANKAPPE